MKKKLLQILYFVCYYLGVIHFFYFLNRRKQCVLVFHHIIPDKYLNNSFEQGIVCTSQSQFRFILTIINKRYEITTEIGKPHTAVITFDDGYRAALIAKDELDKFNNKAIFFLPLSIVGEGPLWIDYIMGWIAYIPDGSYSINDKIYYLNTIESRQKAFSEIIDSLYQPGDYNYQRLINQLEGITAFSGLPISKSYGEIRFKGLANVELENLKKEGHMIGGHSTNHDILSCLSVKDLITDFEDCSKEIGNLYNSYLYAYPFGHERDVSDECINICTHSGFKRALMNEYVNNSSPYKMSRLNVSKFDSRYEIEAKLSGLTQFLKNVFSQI